MCGRYTLTYSDLGEVAELLGAILDEAAVHVHRPRYNIAPTNACIIAAPVRDGGSPAKAGSAPMPPRAARTAGGAAVTSPILIPALWGLRVPGRLVINARAETVAERFHEPFAHGRCVVPADGFYEWRGEREARVPVWFHAPDGRPLLMAGIFEEQRAAPPVFAVLTTPARPPVDAVHDRMPLLLDAEAARRWLEEPPRVVVPSDVALVATEVSQRVNTVANDDPACLDPPASEERGQMSLF